MESPQYHQFGSSENNTVHVEPEIMTQRDMKTSKQFYVLYGIVVLLLLILLLVTGIKFSLLNKEIVDVKLNLELIRTSLSKTTSSSDDTAVREVYLEGIVPVRGRCEEGWVFFQSSCYLLSTTAVRWSKAEEQCKTHSAHLLVLNNVEELDYISKIVEVKRNYWIGLVEREHEGHWSWVDGTDYTSTPTFWDKGQPDDWVHRPNGEDCGQLHASDKRKRKLWNDADCGMIFQYICEARI